MELDPGLFHRNVCANSDGSISTVSVSFTKSISETGVAEGYVQKDYTPYPSVWISRLFVKPLVRGKGIATELMKIFLDTTDKLCLPCILVINSYGGMEYNKLKDFYTSFGFKEQPDIEQGLFLREVKSQQDERKG